MSGFATSPAAAETAYVSAYPFALTTGLGISLACSTASTAATALVDGGRRKTVLTVTNIGDVTGMIALGLSDMGAATTSHFPILPGTQVALSVDPALVTHARGITVSGATTILIHMGFGN